MRTHSMHRPVTRYCIGVVDIKFVDIKFVGTHGEYDRIDAETVERE